MSCNVLVYHILLIGFAISALIMVFGYYYVNIRGTYPVSKVVSKKIKEFLSSPDTHQVFKAEENYKYFSSGNREMKVWAANWPYAYGNLGKIYNNGNIEFSWYCENPAYSVRRAIKNFDR